MTQSVSDDSVAIIGGGPAGLAVARALRVTGRPFTVFEKHGDVGGIWDPGNPGSPMYASAHFISSKTMSGHVGFPMPADYPDYPSHAQILAYIRDFAGQHGLYPHIQFGAAVESVTPEGEGWRIDYRQDGQSHSQRARWLVCASGTNWTPNRPKIEGEERFEGEISHAVAFKDADTLKGQRVLVVGAGNSGVDIACDAAYCADAAFISMRRGYHFLPKHIFGEPADVFGSHSDWMPNWLSQRIFSLLLRLLNGDLKRLGLKKPDHLALSSHPIVNGQLLHYLQHGDIKAKPAIKCLDGRTVTFEDGSRETVDKIILATGYNWALPYLPQDLLRWKDERPETFMKIFIPGQERLFINGYVETNGGAYKMFDEMAELIAQSIEAQAAGGAGAKALADFLAGPEPDLGGGLSYVASARHTGYVNSKTFYGVMKAMRRKLGWPEPDAFYANSRVERLAPPRAA